MNEANTDSDPAALSARQLLGWLLLLYFGGWAALEVFGLAMSLRTMGFGVDRAQDISHAAGMARVVLSLGLAVGGVLLLGGKRWAIGWTVVLAGLSVTLELVAGTGFAFFMYRQLGSKILDILPSMIVRQMKLALAPLVVLVLCFLCRRARPRPSA